MVPILFMWGDQQIGEGMWDRERSYIHLFDNHTMYFLKDLLGKAKHLDSVWLESFISSRVPSPSRKDIDKILKRASLRNYDIWELAEVTRLITPYDSFWISFDYREKREEIFSGNMTDLFKLRVQDNGDSPYSPDGMNTKRFAIVNNEYGILKNPIIKSSFDHYSEVACYELAKLLEVPCCKAYLHNDSGSLKVFSRFEYNFLDTFIAPMKRYVSSSSEGELLDNLISAFPKLENDLIRVVLFDFITRQDDRHMGNLALEYMLNESRLYPLYDNGRSLFFEDSEEFISEAINDVENYSTSFGSIGTYWDSVVNISKSSNISELINLDITRSEIYEALYVYEGIGKDRRSLTTDWVYACVQKLKNL